ncbi:helix-turn-helix domain-containing protein (plasmid) [Actinacidiphila glaucinigra]|uniref:IclR family transcriptional regulator n=1 Tax=Actinacidiphila glaucinigra TaxID=235986 RepID=UPI002DD96C70|nr:IclR family transcriptional regulator C-terminal domain-containing protein [Actinacidiphila glaucinigra]WSD65909.1 helix-turn-helix domain-containing protein [Actinacidiphila glaucinigra]
MGIQQGGTARGAGTRSERVFSVQAAFAALGRPTARLSELAAVAGLDDSTVSRILQSGIYTGHFSRPERGVYALGLGSVALGLQASAYSHDGDAAQVLLQDLHGATDKGLIFLYMISPLGGLVRMCVEMAVGDSDLSELGMTTRDRMEITKSLRVGSPGRAILAYLPKPMQESVLATPSPARAGPGALLDETELLTSLSTVRDCGFATGREECVAGWNSLAAPLFWGDNVVGSVLVMKPADEMPEPSTEYIAAVKDVAAALSRRGDGSTGRPAT